MQYLETPNCRHMATLAVDSLCLSTLNEHSGNANAGDIFCMRYGNVWNVYCGRYISREDIYYHHISFKILTIKL